VASVGGVLCVVARRGIWDVRVPRLSVYLYVWVGLGRSGNSGDVPVL